MFRRAGEKKITLKSHSVGSKGVFKGGEIQSVIRRQ